MYLLQMICKYIYEALSKRLSVSSKQLHQIQEYKLESRAWSLGPGWRAAVRVRVQCQVEIHRAGGRRQGGGREEEIKQDSRSVKRQQACVTQEPPFQSEKTHARFQILTHLPTMGFF